MISKCYVKNIKKSNTIILSHNSSGTFSKSLWLSIILIWIIISMFYNIFNYSSNVKNNIVMSGMKRHFPKNINIINDSDDFLINTPGCTIPNYAKTLKFSKIPNLNQTCGQRAVFVQKISQSTILFRIDEKKMRKYIGIGKIWCCYEFVSRSTAISKMDTEVTYSSCKEFQNGTNAQLQNEVLKVKCGIRRKQIKVLYEDAYIILKKINKTTYDVEKKESWNVLLLGMDTMSRARIHDTMPKTFHHLKKQNWLDYKGYQKVGYNTFPNLMAVLSGKNMSTIYNSCRPSMYECRQLMIWTQFQEAGYVTAYSEDNLRLPDTFSHFGFKDQPTDHYLRPFFLTGETNKGNVVCAHKSTSGISTLKYSFDFVDTYKDEKFFGLFWVNSYSHNLLNSPELFDEKMVHFLEKLESSSALNNTFIVFFSDHGIRYGKTRQTLESHYEERLPMFFMWIPFQFRKQYPDLYQNLQKNQYRLTSHLDLHMTLQNILKFSNGIQEVQKSEACPLCRSLFEEVFPNRTCASAGVHEKWCTCHAMININKNENDVHSALQLAIEDLQNKTKSIKTLPCQRCSLLKLKTVLRTHFYNVDNYTYYVIAFQMQPGDVGYETKILKANGKYEIIQNTDTISTYNSRGNCVKQQNDRPFCVCEQLRNCNSKKNKTNI